ncbi:MAG: hypothetical protein U1F36_13805 [Planctomycetota bacterium]
MDRRIRWAVLLALFAATIVWRTGAFQRPVIATSLTASDAEVWSLLETLDATRALGDHPLRAHPEFRLSGCMWSYEVRWYVQREGSWQAMREGDLSSPWCVYVSPAEDSALPVFCLPSEGPVLVCPLYQRPSDAEFTPDAAMTPGTGRFLTAAGLGIDGNRWIPSHDFDLATLRFRMRDSNGAVISDARLRILSVEESCETNWGSGAKPGFRFEAPVPAGTVFLDGSGEGTLRGPAVRVGGLGFVYLENQWPIPRECVEDHDGVLLVTVPEWLPESIRLNANESHAIATLKGISSAQSQLQASAAIDEDGDEVGEYGFFGELAATKDLRGRRTAAAPALRLAPPVLDASLGAIQRGCASRHGYLFRIYLPDAAGRALGEAEEGGAGGAAVDPQLAEQRWLAYAWPIENGITGKRVFAISDQGDVVSTRNEIGYSGYDNMPAFDAALRSDGKDLLGDLIAANTVGRDGATWCIVQ